MAAMAGCGSPSVTGGDSIARDGRSPRIAATDTVRVLVEMRRPPLGEAVAAGSRLDPAGMRAYVASLNGEVGALLGALRAKGVRLDGVVQYARVWHGFAATVRTSDLTKVQALGLRVEPVRRFYGALARRPRAARDPARPASRPDPRPSGPAVALLDSGVAGGVRGLGARVVNGPDLTGGGPGERHGSAMAAVLAASLPPRERILSLRVARREGDAPGGSATESATTDQVLAGLERAVDPGGDGDPSDAVPVALLGVSSPYAGFDDSPEAQAVRAAAALGTLVVAPAGNDGAGAGEFGTVGSPAAALGALAVGALDGAGPGVPGVKIGIAARGGRALAHGALLGGRVRSARLPAVTLSGPSQANPQGGQPAAGGSALDYLTVDARPKARRRLVVVPFHARGEGAPPLADRAGAASDSGAAALVVCQPDSGHTLAPLPAGAGSRIPVIGVTGGAATSMLDAAGSRGAIAFVSAPRPNGAGGALRVGGSSSRGPTYALAPKPDLVANGTALVPTGARSPQFVSGTSVAAARVAAAAAILRRRRPTLKPDQAAVALETTARSLGAQAVSGGSRPPHVPGSASLLAEGGGRPDLAAATRAQIVASTASLAFPPQPPGRIWTARLELLLSNVGRAPAVLGLTPASAPSFHLAVFPSHFLMAGRSTARVIVTASGGRGSPPWAGGTIAVRGPGSPVAVHVAIPALTSGRPALGAPRLLRRSGSVVGVTFTAGSVQRARRGLAIRPIRVLTLALVDGSGRTVRELTPAGGAPDVLPGEYSYTLPGGVERSLHGRGYRFRVTAQGTAGGSATMESPPFNR